MKWLGKCFLATILILLTACLSDKKSPAIPKKRSDPPGISAVEPELPPALSQKEMITSALKQLNLSQQQLDTSILVCREIPYNKGYSVLVLPKIVYEDEWSQNYETYIAVVDNSTGKIIQKRVENIEDGWTSDAVVLRRVALDFAPYQLSNSVRAFGVRISYAGSSQPNPYSTEKLSLFVPEGKSLKKVLSQIETDFYSGEWDTHCAGEFHTARRKVIIDNKKVNGYYQLLVKGSYTIVENRRVKEICKEITISTKKENTVYTYQNGVYSK